MNSISWFTPTAFIDVDILIVPELAKSYKIDWMITGPRKPAIYSKLEAMASESLHVEFYAIKHKWYIPLSYFEYIKAFKRLVDKGNDLIYVDKAPQFLNYYAAIRTLPVERTIFATHNVKTPKGAHFEKKARYYMSKLLNKYCNFQVFSRNQLEYLENMVQGKNVLYAPLALKDYGKKGERTKHHGIVNFLSFGQIKHYKRIDILIDAAQKLYEETGKLFVVTIAGRCPNWAEYSKRIKYPQLFDLHIGYIDDSKVADLFANANYLVLPYQDLAQSGAITVAFNYGVPVITSDIPQFQEFVEEGVNGFLFQSESVECLKNVMLNTLVMSQDAYNKLLKSTEKYVSNNYSLKAITDRYETYFNQLLLMNHIK